MPHSNPIHWVGVIFLLVASILLLISSITAPVIKDLAMLKVVLTNHTDIRNSSIVFGSFGWCVLDVPPIQTDQDWCSGKQVGYSPASIMNQADGTGFSVASASTADGLTNVQILHPIGAGLAFIAFLLAIGAGVLGSLLGAIVAFIAWIISLVVMATDFTAWGIIRNHVNSDGSGSVASFSTGIWTALAAMVLLFFGMFMVFFTCFAARRAKRNGTYGNGYSDKTTSTTTTRRRRFGLF